ncbi:hypothetical protein [Stutzerimonas nitrititolerans]|uniref:hypothetical protein n=1 Tax=Stutzerimonas nitrititolerans TaxID=2482751 RepID=UPI0028969DF3|nr:hypothetical protein [Stutzerimonas nitrititolerans]
MYLQNILQFCNYGGVSCAGDKFFDGDLEFQDFPNFIRRITDVYEMSETTSFVDWEFEGLANIVYTFPLGDPRTTCETEYLDKFVCEILKDAGKNHHLDSLLAKLYWYFLHDDKEAVWQTLVAYYNKAVGSNP